MSQKGSRDLNMSCVEHSCISTTNLALDTSVRVLADKELV
jgi:hypothetical protein